MSGIRTKRDFEKAMSGLSKNVHSFKAFGVRCGSKSLHKRGLLNEVASYLEGIDLDDFGIQIVISRHVQK